MRTSIYMDLYIYIYRHGGGQTASIGLRHPPPKGAGRGGLERGRLKNKHKKLK